jgi:hypothetical protein
VAVTAILGIIGAALYLARNNVANAVVGDCLKSDASGSLERVGCADPAATFTVIGKIEGKRQGETVPSLCDGFRDRGAEQLYWLGRMGKRGTVLCLAPMGR